MQFRHVPGNLYRNKLGIDLDQATNELVGGCLPGWCAASLVCVGGGAGWGLDDVGGECGGVGPGHQRAFFRLWCDLEEGSADSAESAEAQVVVVVVEGLHARAAACCSALGWRVGRVAGRRLLWCDAAALGGWLRRRGHWLVCLMHVPLPRIS